MSASKSVSNGKAVCAKGRERRRRRLQRPRGAEDAGLRPASQFAQCHGSFLTLLNAWCRPHNVPENTFPFLPCGPFLLTTRLHIAAHCSVELLREPTRMCLPAGHLPNSSDFKAGFGHFHRPPFTSPISPSLVGSPSGRRFLQEPSKIDKLETEGNFLVFY